MAKWSFVHGHSTIIEMRSGERNLHNIAPIFYGKSAFTRPLHVKLSMQIQLDEIQGPFQAVPLQLPRSQLRLCRQTVTWISATTPYSGRWKAADCSVPRSRMCRSDSLSVRRSPVTTWHLQICLPVRLISWMQFSGDHGHGPRNVSLIRSFGKDGNDDS